LRVGRARTRLRVEREAGGGPFAAAGGTLRRELGGTDLADRTGDPGLVGGTDLAARLCDPDGVGGRDFDDFGGDLPDFGGTDLAAARRPGAFDGRVDVLGLAPLLGALLLRGLSPSCSSAAAKSAARSWSSRSLTMKRAP